MMVTISSERYARLTLSEGYLKLILAAADDDSALMYSVRDIARLIKNMMEDQANNSQTEAPGSKNELATAWNDVANMCGSAQSVTAAALTASQCSKQEADNAEQL